MTAQRKAMYIVQTKQQDGKWRYAIVKHSKDIKGNVVKTTVASSGYIYKSLLAAYDAGGEALKKLR